MVANRKGDAAPTPNDDSAAEAQPPRKGKRKPDGLPRKWKSGQHLESWRRQDLEKRNCTKYHYLKFIEKQKVERKLKTCRKLLLAATEAGQEKEAAEHRAQLKALLADHEYITRYPKHLPYNALFPKEDSEASKRRREEIRKLIRAELEQGEQKDSRKESGEANEDDLDDDDFFEAEKPPAKKKKKDLKRLASSAAQEESAKGKKGRKQKAKQERLEVATEEKGEQVRPSNGQLGNKKFKSLLGTEGVKGNKQKLDTHLEKETVNGKKKKKKERPEEGNLMGKRKKNSSLETEDVHPSWQARKSAKLSGALVQGERSGERVVFGSDEEE